MSRFRRVSAIAASVLVAACGDAVAPDSTAPSVSITLTPCCLVTIPGTQVTVDAGATDNIGVAHVEFFARAPNQQTSVKFADDSTAPFSAVYPPTGFAIGDDGAYALSVKAYDAAGNVGTNAVALTVTMDVTPPEVTLTVPAGRITSSVGLPVTVDASEPLSRVEIYDGTARVASAIDPILPKLLFVPITAAENGTRFLTARVWDRAGNRADSPADSAIVDIRWEWDATPVLNGSAYQAVTAVGGSVYAAGRTSGGFADALLVKLDSAGSVVWTRTFGAAGIWEMAESVTRDIDGDVYIGVWRVGATTADRDCILVKYDAGGLEQWARVIDTGAQEQSCHVATDGAGAIYLAGMKVGGTDTSGSSLAPSAFLAKYDRDGTAAWVRVVAAVYGTSPGDFGGLAVDRSGAVYLTGMAHDSLNFSSGRSAFVLKVDSAASEVWKRFVSGDAAAAGEIAVDSVDQVYASGAIIGSGPFVAKYDSGGSLLWTGQFGPGSALAVDARGVYVVGQTTTAVPGVFFVTPGDIFLARFDGGGVLTDVRTYDAQGDEYGFGVAGDGSGAVYLSGWLRGYDTGLVVKYRP